MVFRIQHGQQKGQQTQKRKCYLSISLAFLRSIWYNNVVKILLTGALSEHFAHPTCFKFGIALGSGPRGLGFESRYSDQI